MKLLKGALSFILVLFLFPFPAWGDGITVLTTTWTPYVYEKDGEVTGLSTEIVRAIFEKAGLHGNIRIYSWNRAIITAKTQKNILIYPLMRIKQREDDFIWVAPIFDAKLSLFRLKKNNNIRVRSLSDAKIYTIGVLKGAAMHQFLRAEGFEDNHQLQIFYSNRKSIELLFRERVDLVADNPLVVSYAVRQLAQSDVADIRFSMDRVEEVIPLTRREAYMAFGRGSSPEYVERLQNAWTALETSGVIERIAARYR